MSHPFEAIVLGAGAAGLVCALTAAQRGRRVLLADHLARPGKKLRIAGGGRCNFTNLHMDASHYFGANPRFAVSALARFGPWDAVEFVARFDCGFEERDQGKLFLDVSADRLADGLLDACREAGVTFAFGEPVRSLEGGEIFTLRTESGVFAASRAVLALGGPSWRGAGASDLGFRLARRFGLAIQPPRPALAPIPWTGAAGLSPADLSGISLPVGVSCGPERFVDDLLFTHQGLSGPAALRATLRPAFASAPLRLDFLPGEDIFDVLALSSGKTLARNALAKQLPARLAEALCADVGGRRLADLTRAERDALATRVKDFALRPSGDPKQARAEVTTGGVDTAAICQKTFAARPAPGLYVVGETLDVTGDLGGYNIHWAFVSGMAAGTAL